MLKRLPSDKELAVSPGGSQTRPWVQPLITEMSRFVPRIAARRGIDPVSAQDLFQFIWIVILRKANDFDPVQGPPTRWVYGVASKIAYEMYRSGKRFNLESFDDSDWEAPLQPEDVEGLSAALKARVSLALASKMTKPRRVQIAVLVLLDEEDVKVICKKYGVTPNYIYGVVSDANAILTAFYSKHPDFQDFSVVKKWVAIRRRKIADLLALGDRSDEAVARECGVTMEYIKEIRAEAPSILRERSRSSDDAEGVADRLQLESSPRASSSP